MTAEVNATGRRSFIILTGVFFGTGTMQDVFHRDGIFDCARDMLKITVRIEQSCSAQKFRTLG
jgi:hypothetical protein